MPYPNEHSARLMSPDAEHIRVGRTKGGKVQGVQVPTSISVIWFIQKKEGKEVPIPQALRFPTKRWTSDAAKTWLSKNKIKYIKFEAAAPSKKDAENSIPCYSAYVDKAKKQLDIILHEEIGFYGVQSKRFYELLAENSDVKTIAIDINSPGGSVFDGFSIYNALKAHEAEIRVKVSGIAASIASVIAMAGDIIEMPENATMMIHKPYVPAVYGADADKLRKQAEALDKIEKGIISAYKSRLNKSEKEIAAMLKDTTYFTAKEAHEAGLADLITEEAEILDYHDMEIYKEEYGEIPEAVLNLVDIERNDNLDFNIDNPDDIDDQEGLTNIDRLINFIKNHFSIKKEESSMSDEKLEKLVNNVNELTNRVTALETEKQTLTDANKTLEEENKTLKDTIKNQTEAVHKKDMETRKSEFKSFCEKLVGEGRIKPADIETHVDTMEMKFQADVSEQKNGSKETPKVDAYKKLLNELPVTIPVGDRHVADKDKASKPDTTTNKDPLDEAARKIMRDYQAKGMKITYSAAVKQAFDEDPSLYKEENQFSEQ